MVRILIFFFSFLLLTLVFGQSRSIQQVLDHIDQSILKKDYDLAQSKIDSLLKDLDPKQSGLSFLKVTTRRMEVQIDLGTYAEAVKTGDQLLANYPDLLHQDEKATIWFYTYLGSAYRLTQSNVEKALVYLNQAHERYQALAYPDKKLEIQILSSIGGCYYYLSQYERAINYYQQCQSLINEKTDRTQLVINLRSIGNAYWGLQDYENAAKNYDASLDILYKTDPIDSLTVGQVLHAKGYIHMDQQNYEIANSVFADASAIISRKNPPVSSIVAWVYGDVGRSFLLMEAYDSALYWIQKALNANVFQDNQNDIYQNSPLENINDDFQHFMLLKLKGQSFAGSYVAKRNVADLDGMIDAFLLADQQVDNIRKSIPKTEDQSTISYYSNELYSNAVDAMVDVYRVNPDPRFMELAHYFIEKHKITQVHLKFLEASARVEGLIPMELLDQEQEIIDRIASIKTKSRSMLMENSDSIMLVRQALFEAQESYERFINIVKKDYPSYHASRFDLSVVSTDDLQALLKTEQPKRALISYYNFGDKLRTSLITKDTVIVQVQWHGMDLDESAKTWRNYLIDPDQDMVESDALADLLLGNVASSLEDIEQITFIQDPALQLIPMEVLNYNGAYLLERFDISYHFSTTLFASKKTQSGSNQYNGYAPSFDSSHLQALPGAALEVKALESVFNGTAHLGLEATENAFKNSAGQSDLIHLATHAIVDEQSPESSYLQFSIADSEGEDGKLHFFEIYNLDLNAQLVTLSACNSGYGKIQNGEGVMSLSRAFAYTGVSSTVMSLWSASDKSTPKLMAFFYENLKNGQNKDVALNNARKQYLTQATGKARHPYYWGGFVLIGDSSTIQQRITYVHYSLLTIFLLIIGVLVLRKRGMKKV